MDEKGLLGYLWEHLRSRDDAGSRLKLALLNELVMNVAMLREFLGTKPKPCDLTKAKAILTSLRHQAFDRAVDQGVGFHKLFPYPVKTKGKARPLSGDILAFYRRIIGLERLTEQVDKVDKQIRYEQRFRNLKRLGVDILKVLKHFERDG